MLLKLAKLKELAEALNLTTGTESTKKDYVKLLKDFYIKKDYPNGLPYVEYAPMLCFPEWEMKDEEIANAWASPNWIAQEKLNGCRMILHFVKGKGVYAHSRNESIRNFRYQEMHQSLVFHDLIPNFSATLDAEVIIPKSVDTTNYTTKGEVTKSSLHSTTAVLRLKPEKGRQIQKDQDAYFNIRCFDILSKDGKDIRGLNLTSRLKMLKEVLDHIQTIKDIAPFFSQPEIVRTNKEAFYRKIVSEGGEGVVLKNLDSKYVPSKQRGGWIKVKDRIEYDAFVSGFTVGQEDTKRSDLVGSLEFSVLLEDGTEHVIGYAQAFTDEFREAITVYDKEGSPLLDPSMYDRVAEIGGQNISSRELRLTHCKILRWRDRPGDIKTKEDCVVSKKDLEDASAWVK